MIAFVLKTFFVPGSLALAAVIAIAALVIARVSVFGRRLACAVIGGTLGIYVLLGTPIAASHLIEPLQGRYRPLMAAPDTRAASGIVVLGGGIGRESHLRVAEAARVYRLLGNPWVIVSGGAGRPRPASCARD